MNKPIIGIVARDGISKRTDRLIMHIDDAYRRAVIKSGGVPLLIMPIQDAEYNFEKKEFIPEMSQEEKENLIRVLNNCDGILLPGGMKIFEYDKFICNYALEHNIPILGICLGMQIMAAIDCGPERIIQPIDNGVNHKSEDKFIHKVKINKDSFLYNIVGNEEFSVSSKHKCKITKTNEFDVVRIF